MSETDHCHETDRPAKRRVDGMTIVSRFGEVAVAQARNKILVSLLDLLQGKDSELRSGIEKLYYDIRREIRGKTSLTIRKG